MCPAEAAQGSLIANHTNDKSSNWNTRNGLRGFSAPPMMESVWGLRHRRTGEPCRLGHPPCRRPHGFPPALHWPHGAGPESWQSHHRKNSCVAPCVVPPHPPSLCGHLRPWRRRATVSTRGAIGGSAPHTDSTSAATATLRTACTALSSTRTLLFALPQAVPLHPAAMAMDSTAVPRPGAGRPSASGPSQYVTCPASRLQASKTSSAPSQRTCSVGTVRSWIGLAISSYMNSSRNSMPPASLRLAAK